VACRELRLDCTVLLWLGLSRISIDSLDKVEYSAEPFISGRPSTSGGKSTVKFSTLKKSAANEDTTEFTGTLDKISLIDEASPHNCSQSSITTYNVSNVCHKTWIFCLRERTHYVRNAERNNTTFTQTQINTDTQNKSGPSEAGEERAQNVEYTATWRERKPPPIYILQLK